MNTNTTNIAAAERELFESGERATGSNLARTPDGHYENPCTQSAWEGWLCRAIVAHARERDAQAGQSRPAFPERDEQKPAEQQGLFRKFDVRRVDGSDQPGGRHHGCSYFVLDLSHDQHAPAAMRAYAAACRATHPQLADDIEREFAIAPAAEAGIAPPDPEWPAGEQEAYRLGVAAALAASKADVPTIEFTLRQAEALVEFFGGHDGEVSVMERPSAWADQPDGLYAYCTEYPDEGCQYLGPTEVDDELAINGRASTTPAADVRDPTEITEQAAYDMGAKGAPATDRERMLFEAWISGHNWSLNAIWNGHCYIGSSESTSRFCPHAMRTRQLWAAWRDSAALRTTSAAPADAAKGGA